MMPRVDGAGCPRERTEDESDSADGIDALGATEVRGTHEQRNTRKPKYEADQDARSGPDAAGPQPIENDHPQRDAGHQERGNARRDSRLGPGKRAITAEQQEEARDDRGAPLRRRGLFFAQMAEDRIENQADGDMPDARQNKGRNRFDANSNKEIGGAPENVDRGESNEDVSTRGGRIARGRCGNFGNRRRGLGAHSLAYSTPR